MFPFFASRFANQEIRVTIALQCSWRHWRLHYLNNRVFLSRNYRLIFAPRKFDVFNFLSCAPLNFLLHASSKMISNYFQLIKLKSWQPNVKYEKEDCQNLIEFQLFIFDMPACLWSTIHPRFFGGRTLCADSVSPRMNTIASRDQSKPIRIGENLMVNYNKRP